MSEKTDDTTTKSEGEGEKKRDADSAIGPAEAQRIRHAAALDVVKSRREELAGAPATEKAPADESKEKPETENKSEAGADETQADAGEEKKETKPRTFTDEEIAKSGFFDSLDKEGWAALEKQHPAIVALYKSGKADLTRLGQKLQERKADLDEREAALAGEKKTASTAAATTEEEEELKALGFTTGDVEKLLGSKVAQRVIGQAAEQVVKSMGVDPERTEAQMNGFELALSDYPELKDDEVWNAVQQKILADPKEARALDAATSDEEIARILGRAAGRIIADRAAKTKAVETKEDKKREKETTNATKPVSRAIGKPRVASASTDDPNAPMSREKRKEQMRQFVADTKAKAGYKELR